MASRSSLPHDVNMSETMTPSSSSAPPPPGPPGANRSERALYRSRNERMIAGVAGGLADRYGWDPAFVRIVFVLIGLMSAGSGIVAYVVAWLVIPEHDTGAVRTDEHVRGRMWLGAVLLGLGLMSVLDVLGLDNGPGRVAWPLMLVGAGVALLVVRRSGENHAASEPSVKGYEPSVTVASAYESRRHWPDLTSPGAGSDPGPSRADDPSSTRPFPSLPPFPPFPRRIRASHGPLSSIVWGLIFLYFGTVWLLAATEAIDIDAVTVLAGALGIVGIGLVVSSFFDRARGLIGLGAVIVVACTALSVIDVPFRGGIGERTYRPERIEDVNSTYQLAMGELELDLRFIDFTSTDRLDIELTAGIGEVRVLLPDAVGVEVRARADAGEVDLPQAPPADGIDVDERGVFGDTDDIVVVIDARVGLGAISVINGREQTEVVR